MLELRGGPRAQQGGLGERRWFRDGTEPEVLAQRRTRVIPPKQPTSAQDRHHLARRQLELTVHDRRHDDEAVRSPGRHPFLSDIGRLRRYRRLGVPAPPYQLAQELAQRQSRGERHADAAHRPALRRLDLGRVREVLARSGQSSRYAGEVVAAEARREA